MVVWGNRPHGTIMRTGGKCVKIHVVKKGDTLYLIAKKYNVALEELIAANPEIANPDEIDVGMKIKIPMPANPAFEIMHQHTVQQGDTLWKLSKAWGIPLETLIKANPQLKNPNVLLTGEIVNIPKIGSGHFGGGHNAPATGAANVQPFGGWPSGKKDTGVKAETGFKPGIGGKPETGIKPETGKKHETGVKPKEVEHAQLPKEANIAPNIEPHIKPNVEPNIGPNIANVEPNIGVNIAPNIAPNIEPNIAPHFEPNIAPNIAAVPIHHEPFKIQAEPHADLFKSYPIPALEATAHFQHPCPEIPKVSPEKAESYGHGYGWEQENIAPQSFDYGSAQAAHHKFGYSLGPAHEIPHGYGWNVGSEAAHGHDWGNAPAQVSPQSENVSAENAAFPFTGTEPAQTYDGHDGKGGWTGTSDYPGYGGYYPVGAAPFASPNAAAPFASPNVAAPSHVSPAAQWPHGGCDPCTGAPLWTGPNVSAANVAPANVFPSSEGYPVAGANAPYGYPSYGAYPGANTAVAGAGTSYYPGYPGGAGLEAAGNWPATAPFGGHDNVSPAFAAPYGGHDNVSPSFAAPYGGYDNISPAFAAPYGGYGYPAAVSPFSGYPSIPPIPVMPSAEALKDDDHRPFEEQDDSAKEDRGQKASASSGKKNKPQVKVKSKPAAQPSKPKRKQSHPWIKW